MADKTKARHLTDLPIVGERFIVDQVGYADAYIISAYRSDIGIRPEMREKIRYLHDVRDWISEQRTTNNIQEHGLIDDEEYLFVIKDRKSNTAIGDIEITLLPFYIEMSVVINPEHQGFGAAEDGMRMLMEWLREIFPDHFFAIPVNPKSQIHMNLMDRLGFKVWPAVAYGNNQMFRTIFTKKVIKGKPSEKQLEEMGHALPPKD